MDRWNVEDIKDEGGTREYHTRREVEEGKFWAHVDRDEDKEDTDRPKCRSKHLAVTRKAVRDEFNKIHGDHRDELGKTREENATGSVKYREG